MTQSQKSPNELLAELLSAIQNGSCDEVKHAFSTIPEAMYNKILNETYDEFGLSALHNAIEAGNLPVIQVLCEKGSKVNIQDKENASTPLHLAAKEGNLNVIKFLLAEKANINSQDSYLCQPVHYAAKNGKLEALTELVTAGANINSVDKYGWTPLHFSVSSSNEQCVKFLLLQKAVILKDKNGRTPADIAKERDFGKIAALFS